MSNHPNNQLVPIFVQTYVSNADAVKTELQQGLLAAQATTSPKYLYDALGSRLFDAITELPEYYPTRVEASIVAQYQNEIAEVIGQGQTLIDLGAGSCEKAAKLFPALQPSAYVAVDISVDYLKQVLQRLQQQHPSIRMMGVGMDFSQNLTLPPEVQQIQQRDSVFLYPGSSIGNFTPSEAGDFLMKIHAACQDQSGQSKGGLLIGVDLVKDHQVLQAAYDDALGVTAAFNRNMLLHINHLLGSDFDIKQWQHRALFNVELSRIEMHLDATENVTVRWPQGERRFVKGQNIHTENSYKYQVADFQKLLLDAGFQNIRHWQDTHKQFCVFWAQA